MNKKLEVLCVDDEPQILEGLKLHLKQRFIVHVANSGAEGLAVLQQHTEVAVILSDMRMPAMDGAKFLNAARTASPNSVRMLLTGYTDMQSAIAAVNEGQIFRFISKPCPPDQLLAAFAAAVTQHRLIIAEKVLLQETLLGCVESLAKVLSLTKPLAFGRALRLRSKVHALISHLHWEAMWQTEAAAILSQLGAVTLSEETLMKLNEGDVLEGGRSPRDCGEHRYIHRDARRYPATRTCLGGAQIPHRHLARRRRAARQCAAGRLAAATGARLGCLGSARP